MQGGAGVMEDSSVYLRSACWGRYNIIIVWQAQMRQRQSAYAQPVAYSQNIKLFLANYRVHPCMNGYQHSFELCQEYHSEQDRRRNPYDNHGFLYQPSQYCNCGKPDCIFPRNPMEMFYHPLLYKSSNCPNYNCNMGFLCNMIHENQYELINKYQFFRFDLDSFKTQTCPNRTVTPTNHELASCRFYHNDSDRRRNPKKITYSHVQCPRSQCNDLNCPFAHNKIQQLYHPSRYKTKYCQSFIHKKMCQYHEFCSFAHSDSQITIELLHLQPVNQSFYDYKYKTVWCPYTNQHDRSECPYAHNFQDYRRDPRMFNYAPQLCPHWNLGQIKSIEDSGCPLKMSCPKSHGWLEKKYYPDVKKPERDYNDQTEVESSEKSSKSKEDTKQKKQSMELFGVGAPFFKSQAKIRGQSEPKVSTTQKVLESSRKQDKNKGFTFSFFIPLQTEEWNPNSQKDFKTFEKQYVLILESGKQQEVVEKQYKQRIRHSLQKSKIVKKHKIEYTKSLKQLLRKVGLDEKIESVRLSQIKLLGMADEEISNLETLSQSERNLLKNIIFEYIKSHKLTQIQYSNSMVYMFKRKSSVTILEKMRKRGVPQKHLQNLSPSLIEELSFLEEEEKKELPKILQQYADDRAFRELNSLITQQMHKNPVKNTRYRKSGQQNVKT